MANYSYLVCAQLLKAINFFGRAYLGSSGSNGSIVEEAEAHGSVALSMVPRWAYYGHACCSLLPIVTQQVCLSAAAISAWHFAHVSCWHSK